MTRCLQQSLVEQGASVFVCPHDHAAMEQRETELVCGNCDRTFPIHDDIVDFRGEAPRRWAAAQQYEIEFWDRDAAAPEQREAMYRRGASAIAARFVPHRPIDESSRILQVGTAGHAEIHYFNAAMKCAAEPLAVELHRHGLLVPGDVRWACTMGERLPFANGAFTHAIMANMIDHVAQPDDVLAEVYRCLEPGGVAHLSCNVSAGPLLPLFRGLSAARLGYFRGHLWFFTAGGLQVRAKRAGFEIAEAESVRAAKGWQGWQGGLQRSLRPLLVTPHVMVLRKEAESWQSRRERSAVRRG